MSKNRLMRIGGIVLELGLGAFLVMILISAWNSQSSYAKNAIGKSGKARAASRSGMLPVQGTPVLDLCLQDDSTPTNVVQFNRAGDYVFCCGGSVMASGHGVATVRGNVIEIVHNTTSYRVLIKVDTSVGRGTATLQLPPSVTKCVIIDRNIFNNTCQCGVTAGTRSEAKTRDPAGTGAP